MPPKKNSHRIKDGNDDLANPEVGKRNLRPACETFLFSNIPPSPPKELPTLAMVHADASNFPPTITKPAAYAHVHAELTSLIHDQRNWICNLANAASLLWHMFHALPAPANAVNWCGFYVLDPSVPTHDQLILGPFMGKVACQTIKFGRGVCGSVAAAGETRVVRDTEAWEGHIACDSESRSEIVVPVKDRSGKVVGVLDVDCTVVDGFGDVDVKGLEAVAELLGEGCDW